MKIKMKVAWLFFGVLLSIQASATPQISVGAMYEFMNEDESTLVKRIRNSGSSTAFVRVSVSEIHYDAQGKVRETPQDNSRIFAQQSDGMIASPSRLIIPVQGMQAVRLLFTGDRSKERYWRIRFVPVQPETPEEFGQTPREFEEHGGQPQAGVSVLTGFGTLVALRPRNVQFAVDRIETASNYSVTNNGNTTVVLDNFRECAKALKACEQPVLHYLLPGARRVFQKKDGRSYAFTLQEGERETRTSFGAL